MVTRNSSNTYIVPTTANEVTAPAQPAFRAYLSSQKSSVTGDGSTYTIIFNTELYDQNADFDVATGIFTAPVTGRYQLSTTVACLDIDANHTDYLIQISTSNWSNDQVIRLNPSGLFSNATMFTASSFKEMDAADTARITLTISGGTKAVDILNGRNGGSSFSGFLKC